MSKNMALPVLFTMLLGSSLLNAAAPVAVTGIRAALSKFAFGSGATAPVLEPVASSISSFAAKTEAGFLGLGALGASVVAAFKSDKNLFSVNPMDRELVTDFSSYDEILATNGMPVPVVVEKTSFQKVSDAVKAHPYITAASVSAIAVVVYAVAKKLQDKKEASQEVDFVRSQVITA